MSIAEEWSAQAEAAIVCEGLIKSFHGASGVVWALRGVDLTVPRGGLMMLVGPSGCGKTTLLTVIAGLLKRDGGRCRVLGTDIEVLDRRDQLDFRARHIGFIFQHYNLLPSITIADNVAIPLMINGTPRRTAVEAARQVLNEVGLGQRWEELPDALSGGEQQRVAIARALAHAPDLVVCDEPTSALDHDTGLKIMALMRRIISERGTTLLIVTHDNRIFPFADRIAHMDDGRIVDVTEGAAKGARL